MTLCGGGMDIFWNDTFHGEKNQKCVNINFDISGILLGCEKKTITLKINTLRTLTAIP